MIWRHRHETNHQEEKTAGTLILVGDTFHNFLDGFVIAAAFLHSIPLGIAASLATIAHEVPQEVSDFALLLQSGYSRSRALLLNFLSGSGTLVGAILGYFFLEPLKSAIPFIMILAGASFLYIATADIVPTLHRYRSFLDSVIQFVLLLFGIFTILLLREIQH
ncbi:MAG TPA: ZIP family metal transporter [Fimbriimonadales bacterium]|nr:ZIP family metal transporter [Fimbriimonadales bacterium]